MRFNRTQESCAAICERYGDFEGLLDHLGISEMEAYYQFSDQFERTKELFGDGCSQVHDGFQIIFRGCREKSRNLEIVYFTE